MGATLLFVQHGFGAIVTATGTPGVTVFQEVGEAKRAHAVSVKNTGSLRVLLLVNVDTDPAALANMFNNLNPIPLEAGDAFTYTPHPVVGHHYKNIAYMVDPAVAGLPGSGSGSGTGGSSTLIISAH